MTILPNIPKIENGLILQIRVGKSIRLKRLINIFQYGHENQRKSTNVIKNVLLDFSLTVKAATLIFISWRCSAISSAKEEKSGFIYNLVKS